MDIFIGMETSGVSRRAFQALGHRVVSCDLLPADDGSPDHIQGDVFEVFEMLSRLGKIFDLGLFHPDCTFLTNSAAWAFKDPDYAKYPGVGYHQKVKPGTLVGQARRDARDRAVLDVKRCWKLPTRRKAVENPVGALSSRWRKPTQIVQPNWFGDDASKATCLWLDDLPLLTPTRFVEPRMVCDDCRGHTAYLNASKGCRHCGAEAAFLKPRWANQTDSGQSNVTPSDDRWKLRSGTFPGTAAAWALTWGGTNTGSDLIDTQYLSQTDGVFA